MNTRPSWKVGTRPTCASWPKRSASGAMRSRSRWMQPVSRRLSPHGAKAIRCDDLMAPHTRPHMSPAQAAQAANVSRWAIMRAINSHKLKANRDNRNHWKISPDELDKWCAHSVRIAHPAHPEESLELREKLASETARADAAERARDQAESDRDRWRGMAEKLADKPRRGWWWL